MITYDTNAHAPACNSNVLTTLNTEMLGALTVAVDTATSCKGNPVPVGVLYSTVLFFASKAFMFNDVVEFVKDEHSNLAIVPFSYSAGGAIWVNNAAMAAFVGLSVMSRDRTIDLVLTRFVTYFFVVASDSSVADNTD